MNLFQSGNGRLGLVNDLGQEWRRMRTGEQYSVRYRVDFPVQSPLPTVKSITVNNQLICRGSKPSKCTNIIRVQSLLTKEAAQQFERLCVKRIFFKGRFFGVY
jgi:hypothetical protein